MRSIVIAAALLALAGAAQAASPTGEIGTPPNIVGTWKPTGQSAVARVGGSFAGWSNDSAPKFKLHYRPTVVVATQEGRGFAGYKVLADGSKDRFVGVFRHDGTHLITSSDNGRASGEILGNEIEWCWTDTLPKTNVAACDMLKKVAAK